MNIPPIQSSMDTSNIPIEDLAGSKYLTQQQKIHEASRQFEKIMLQQILEEVQKPVITSEFTDDSMASDIYQGYITNALADSMSKSGLGFAKIFEEQLSPHASKAAQKDPVTPVENRSGEKVNPPSTTPP